MNCAWALRRYAVAAACGLIILLSSSSYGQINLPSQRADIENDGVFFGLDAYAEIDNSVFDFNEGQDDDFDDVLVSGGVGADKGNSEGEAHLSLTAYAELSTATNATEDVPTFDTYVTTSDTADAYSAGNTTATAAGSASAIANFTILANSNNPNAGTAANSATLTSNIWIVITGGLDGNANFDGDITVAVGGSWLFVAPLDNAGQNWNVAGQLDQSSSSNPTATPFNVNANFIGSGINELYVGTTATSVGGTPGIFAQVDVRESTIIADDNSQSSYPSSATDMRTYLTSGWFKVEVP